MPRPIKHTEATRFRIFALWLQGWSEIAIARRCGVTRGQAGGIIRRSPYSPRPDRETRQRMLTDLADVRDGNGHAMAERFPDLDFIAEEVDET